MTITGNHGFCNRELIALPGHAEEVTESSIGLREGYFIWDGIFCLVSWALVLIMSIKLLNVLQQKLDKTHCLEGCYQMESQSAAPGRQQGTGYFLSKIFPYCTLCYRFLAKKSFKSSFKEALIFLEASQMCPTLGHLQRAPRLLFITFPSGSWVRLIVKTGKLSLLYLEQARGLLSGRKKPLFAFTFYLDDLWDA